MKSKDKVFRIEAIGIFILSIVLGSLKYVPKYYYMSESVVWYIGRICGYFGILRRGRRRSPLLLIGAESVTRVYARAGFDSQGNVYCAHAIKLDAPRGGAAEAVKRVSTKSFVQLELVYPSAAQSKAKEARPPAQAAFSTSLFIDTTTQSCPEVDLQNRMSKHSCTTTVVASCIFVSRLIAKSYLQEIQARSSRYKTGFLCYKILKSGWTGKTGKYE